MKNMKWLSLVLVLVLCLFAPDAQAGTPVAKITSASNTTGTTYTDFADALAAWKNGTTLTLLADVSCDSDITLAANATYTLDCTGYTLSATGENLIWGTLNFTGGTLDSMFTVLGTMNATDGTISETIQNRGTVTLSNTKIVDTGYYAVSNDGALIIKNGSTLQCFSYDSAAEIWGGDYCSVKIDNTVDPAGWRIKNDTDVAMAMSSITLPDDYYVFVDDKAVTELAVGAIGIITKHTDHTYTYTANGDGTHDGVCEIGCGTTVTGEPCELDGSTCKLCGGAYVASVTSGSSTTIYADFADALAAWTDGTKLTLLADVSCDKLPSPDNNNATYTLDCTGYTLSTTDRSQLKGTLNFTGGTLGGGLSSFGTLNATDSVITGTFANSGTATLSDTQVGYEQAYYAINNYGTLTIKDGSTLKCNSNILAAEILNHASATVKIENTVDPEGWRIQNYSDAAMATSSITLPDGYYVFVDGKIVTELAANQIGTIKKHTTHTYDYTCNGDGTHNGVCEIGCGTTVTDEDCELDGNTCKLCGGAYVASVTSGSTVTMYTDFADALAAWTNGTKLTLLADVSCDKISRLDNNNATYTLDCTGYTLSTTGRSQFTGTLNFIGGTLDGGLSSVGTLNATDSVITGTFKNSGTATLSDTQVGYEEAYYAINNYGTLTIKGDSTLQCDSHSSAAEIRNQAGATVKIENTVVPEGWRIQNYSDAAMATSSITLPDGYYVFVDGKIVTELAANQIGTIKKHTTHTYDYICNGDGTHDGDCEADCGATVTGEACELDGNTCKLCKGVYVASITNGTTTAIYADFAKALAAWKDGTTLTLLGDVSYTDIIYLDAGERTFAGGNYTLTSKYGINVVANSKLTVNSGTVSSASYDAISVGANGTLSITGGTLKGTGQAAAVCNSGTVNISGGTLDGDHSGLYNTGKGVATITAGTIKTSGWSPIYADNSKVYINSNCTLEGGESSLRVISEGRIVIAEGVTELTSWTILTENGEGSAVGHKTDDTTLAYVLPVGYYAALNGESATELESGYSYNIVKHTTHTYDYTCNGDGTHDGVCEAGCGATVTDEDCELDGNTCKLCGGAYVASVTSGSTVTMYTDFADALTAWTDGTTLALLADVSCDKISRLHNDSATYTFDCNGHTLSTTSVSQLEGTLHFTGGTLDGSLNIFGTLNATDSTITGTILNGGNVTLSEVQNAVKAFFAINNYGTLTIKDGSTLQCYPYDSAAEILNHASATVKIENTVDPEGWRIQNYSDAAMATSNFTLPADYYVFVGEKIVTELAADQIGTIRKHEHAYEYTTEDLFTQEYLGVTITQACSCGFEEYVTIKIPQEVVYNGQQQLPIIEKSDNAAGYTITYNNKTQLAAEDFIDAGAYTVSLCWNESDCYRTLKIHPKPLTAKLDDTFTRAYDRSNVMKDVPLILDGVVDGDDVSATAEFWVALNYVGEYNNTELYCNTTTLAGDDAANYTLDSSDVTFTKAAITKAEATLWNIATEEMQVLVGSGLSAVTSRFPEHGIGIAGETVGITSLSLYTDAALQTAATDGDISSLTDGKSITLYYKATADNYQDKVGEVKVTAIDHQHEWTLTADDAQNTITATCSGTIGTCPNDTVTYELVAPTGLTFGSDVKTASCQITPEGAAGMPGYVISYKAKSATAELDMNGEPYNAGDYTATLTVSGSGEDQTVSVDYTIAPEAFDDSIEVSASPAAFTYNGEEQKPNVNVGKRYTQDSDAGSGTLVGGGMSVILQLKVDQDYTVTYPADMVNAGEKTITITGQGNYTGSTTVKYTIAKATPTAEDFAFTAPADLIYDGTAKTATVAPKAGVTGMGEVSVSYYLPGAPETAVTPIDVNEYRVAAAVAEGDNYTAAELKPAAWTFNIAISGTAVTAQADKEAYTYGETITVTARCAATGEAPATFALRAAPAADQMALFLGDTQISDAADAVNGTYTMTVNTADKALEIGSNTLRVVYISNGNLANGEATVTVQLNQKELTIVSAEAADRPYAKDNKLVDVTGVILDGVIGADEVIPDLTNVQGTLASDNAGTYTTLALPQLTLKGSEKDYYTIAADEDVATDVTIDKAKLVSVTLPTDTTLDVYLATAEQAAEKLPATITYTDAAGMPVVLNAAWSCTDFDTTPKAENTFTWTVELLNHEAEAGVATAGTILVTNTDALPVTLTGTDDSITFAQQPYDVAAMFTVDTNAGTASYEIDTASTGEGALEGTKLTVTKVGDIIIRLTTEANGAYAAAEATAKLTVTKADPAVTAPEGLTAICGQTLGNVNLPDHADGKWVWVRSADDVGESGVQTHQLTFAPNDTTNWNTLTLDAQVTVSKKTLDVTLAVFNGETQTSTFTYGETVTVKAKPYDNRVYSLRSFTAPAANQMALFLNGEQISQAADADANGIYTMTIDTADKALKIGNNTITAKYVGTASAEDAQADTTVILLKKQLTIVNMAAQSRVYQPENQQVTVTAVELAGKIEGDDVAVSALTAQVSSANVGTYASATLPQSVPLTGADADYYEAAGAVEVPVPQTVSITQATPTPTGTGADAGQPTVTPVTEDGKTLADVPLTLPENAYNVPGTIHWVESDDTPVEKGEEYAWVFIPGDPNYGPVTGTLVIYPEGEAPVITDPAAAQTVTVVEGETGTMTVTATEADAYQWYVNRNDGKGYVVIVGATAASYTTGQVTPDNDGFTYYCAVSNVYGESKSPAFTLKVQKKVDVPQTGDEAQLGLWLALMALGLGGLILMATDRRRREN